MDTSDFVSSLEVEVGNNSNQWAVYPDGIMSVVYLLGIGATGILRKKLPTEKKMIETIQKAAFNDSPEIQSANSLYFDNRLDLYTDYYQTVKKVAEIEFFDMEAPETVDEINDWIQSGSGFRNVLQTTVGLRLIALNTLWFTDQWSYKFPRMNTKEEPFRSSNGEKMVPMMNMTAELLYVQNEKSEDVRLSFKHGAHADFYFGERFPDSDLTEGTVVLSLPRFTHEVTIDVRALLEKVGLSDLFQPGNLERISEASSSLAVSEAIQKICCVFDEDGAEVRAVTGGFSYWGIPKEDARIIFDRPFNYRVCKNGIDLIVGRYDGQ